MIKFEHINRYETMVTTDCDSHVFITASIAAIGHSLNTARETGIFTKQEEQMFALSTFAGLEPGAPIGIALDMVQHFSDLMD